MVAIKCVSKRSLNRASVENLLTEIEILKTIRHPHIVELKDFQVGLGASPGPASVWLGSWGPSWLPKGVYPGKPVQAGPAWVGSMAGVARAA